MLTFFPSWSIWLDARNFFNMSGQDDVLCVASLGVYVCPALMPASRLRIVAPITVRFHRFAR